MGRLFETYRGGSVVARWLIGAPFVNLRILRTAQSRADAHRILCETYERLLASGGWSVEVSGTPPAPGQGCVICYNETSFPDIFAHFAKGLPYCDRMTGAEVYRWIPFTRAAVAKAGFEFVVRGNREATSRVMDRMVEAVRSGERVAWGGEGRLSGRDAVARFKVGASLVAIRAGAPLVPVAYYGGHRAMPLGSVRARPGKLYIRFGTPMPTAGLQESDARDFADRAHAAVAGMYEELRAVSLAEG